MDGVLVDGEPLHFEAVNQLLRDEGRSLTLDEYRPYMGTKSGWAELIRDHGLAHPVEHYSPRYRDLILAQYREKSAALPGAIDLLAALRRTNVRLGLASSSLMPWVDACLDRIGLRDAFDEIVTGSDVNEGKPSPEIYLLAAERLGVAPARCLAIEDAPAGVASAKAAGMTCWAVRTEYTEGLPLPGADRVYASLREIGSTEITEVAA